MNFFFWLLRNPDNKKDLEILPKEAVVFGGLGEGEGQGPGTVACTVRLRLKVPLRT